jgi:hypothetical protein
MWDETNNIMWKTGGIVSEQIVKLNDDISSRLTVFQGLSFQEIAYKVGINPHLVNSKLSIVTLVRKMFDFIKLDEKQLANEINPLQFSLKTVRLKENEVPKESMSFEQVNFMTLVEEQWESSHLYKKFNETVFLFIVFQSKKNGSDEILFFKGSKVWKMPQETLESELKEMWKKTKMILEKGVEITPKQFGKRTFWQNNLPGMKDSPIAHIRPKAKDANDKVELPDGQFITKQAYWLNAKYISEILSDLPAVIFQNTSVAHTDISPKEQIKKFKMVLKNSIYTLSEFCTLGKDYLEGFSLNDINHMLLAEINYKIDSHFILSNQFENANEYFEKTILQSDYFHIPKNEVFQDSFAKRKLANLENAYKIIKIEDNTFITDTCLKRANVQIDCFLSYKNAVEQFVNTNEFFSLLSLRKDGFQHDLEELGFGTLFYQSILKRPGRLKYLYIGNYVLFIKTPYSISINHLILELMNGQDYINIDEIVYELRSRWEIDISFDSAILIAKSTDFYYSEELEKIFINKDLFYHYIYRS